MGFGGFSWKRATGISALKSRMLRSTGLPWTRSGRQRKLGAMMTGGWSAGGKGGGCLLVIVAGIVGVIVLAVLVLW